ncbi:MAG: VWA domain-containing protein [Ignavibacteria bacterium]|nr:VWA domain-containing protein [Ignavibacteria bacterium]
MEKPRVYNLLILDESGSMESIKTPVISGFNEIVQTIRNAEKEFPGQEHFVSYVTFNTGGIKTILDAVPAAYLQPVNEHNYRPNSGTPLYDAIGFSVNNLKQRMNGSTYGKVLVTILTDGFENSSREYSGENIKKMIEKLKDKGWTFTYIGTDHDVYKSSGNISIDNFYVFDKSSDGAGAMFVNEKSARMRFYRLASSDPDSLTKNYSYFDNKEDSDKN